MECALPQEFSDFNQINMDKDTLVTLGIMMEIASVAVFTVAFFVAIFSKDYRKKSINYDGNVCNYLYYRIWNLR